MTVRGPILLDAVALLDLPRERLKAAFFDLDGTLVDASNSASEPSRQAIQALKAAGVIVGAATGRPLFGCREIIAGLGITGPSLFFSGGLILDLAKDHTIYSAAIKPELLLRLLQAARAHSLYCEFYTRDQFFVEEISPLREMHYHYLRRYPVLRDLEVVAASEQVLKAVLITADAVTERAMRSLTVDFPELQFGFSTGAADPQVLFANITDPEASRERGFRELLRYLGLAATAVAAFGDAESDITFLKLAGFGVAMGNAPELVKNEARFVTKPITAEGVAFALQQLRGCWT